MFTEMDKELVAFVMSTLDAGRPVDEVKMIIHHFVKGIVGPAVAVIRPSA